MRGYARNHRTLLGLVPFAALVAAGASLAGPPSPVRSPYGPVAWSELAYSAHKFFLGASTSVRVERVSADAVGAALPSPPSGRPVPIPLHGCAVVAVDTDLPFGRDEAVRLFFDPPTGAALGGEKTMLGGAPYHKLFRYTEGGLFTWRAAPADEREATMPPSGWSRRRESFVQPDVAPPAGAVVADSYALIYLVSAAHLERRGESVHVYMLADDRFIEMTFTAGGLTYDRVAFDESWPGGRRRREGDVLVRKVRATGRALAGPASGEDVELGFLGMRGTLTVDLEVGTDLPVALAGRVQHIGELTVRLKRAVLAAAPAPPSR